MFERVIASRIGEHFPAGRSTTDSLDRVCAGIRDALRRGDVAIAVSIDIKNAFNTVPWSAIRDGLTSKSCQIISCR